MGVPLRRAVRGAVVLVLGLLLASGCGLAAWVPDDDGPVGPRLEIASALEAETPSSAVEDPDSILGESALPPAAPTPVQLTFDASGFPSYPLPDGAPEALTPATFRAGGFGEPLPRSPVWNPPGQKRVGLQAGHWKTDAVPFELRRLSPGTSAGGWDEAEVNLLVATRAAAILEDAGVAVDILPAAIPIRYRAHAFVAIHADGDLSGAMHGYKIARPGFSSIPDTDDDLVRLLYREYGAATDLPTDDDAHISRRMTYYYAFNARRYQHALDLGTPAAIIEAGFLTNSGDRALLTGRPDLVGQGIANGILRFLELEHGATTSQGGSESGGDGRRLRVSG